MHFVFLLFIALTFVALTPGVLVTLPKGGKRMTVVYVHAAIFAVVLYFGCKVLYTREMFQDTMPKFSTGVIPKKAPPPVFKSDPIQVAKAAVVASAAAVTRDKAQVAAVKAQIEKVNAGLQRNLEVVTQQYERDNNASIEAQRRLDELMNPQVITKIDKVGGKIFDNSVNDSVQRYNEEDAARVPVGVPIGGGSSALYNGGMPSFLPKMY